MSRYFSKGMIALFATTALTHQVVLAQDADASDDELVQSTIVIRGEFIPDEKRETSEVSSLLDASDFSAQGDSDIAGALKRVTGVSIADGKFVIVRGLNERYSSSTLNGSPLPSPEPLRRVAPLDLFPTSVLESTLVQKTFSPEQSGEFGGGSVDIRTKSVPDFSFFNVGVSIGGDDESTFRDGLSYRGGGSDYFASDDGKRDLPGSLVSALDNGGYDDLSDTEKNQLSQAIVSDPDLFVLRQGMTGPDVGYNASGGTSFDLGNGAILGVLGAASYSNEWTGREIERGFDNLSGDGLKVRYDSIRGVNTSSWNALGAVGLNFLDSHDVQLTGFVTRSSDKLAELNIDRGPATFILGDKEEVIQTEDLRWIERQLWTVQARGSHLFTNLASLEADWRLSQSKAERDAPFGVSNLYLDGGNDALRISPTELGISFSDITEDTSDAAIDLMLPLVFGDITLDVKAGVSHIEKERDTRSFEFFLAQNGPADRLLRIDQFYQQSFALDDDFFFEERGGDSYPSVSSGQQTIDAYYVGLDSQLTPYLRAAIGGRIEDGTQELEVRSFLNDAGQPVPSIEEQDFLPAATLTWNFADDLQLRVGYSETLTRPQFRELSPTLFSNIDTGQTFYGNPFLTNSALTNYDARMEYYFGRDQFITLGLFYKEIEKPIEEIDSGRETPTTTFANSPKAEVQGFEVEYEQGVPFDQWLDWEWLAPKAFSVKTNYTFTDSSVDSSSDTIVIYRTRGDFDPTDPDQRDERDAAGFIIDGRKLQGQSEHLFNFQFGFTDDDARSDANLLVNFASERIRAAGNRAQSVPDVIEQPPVLVDLVYNRTFDFIFGEYAFGLKLQNLLDEPYKAFQETDSGEVIVERYDVGRSVSFSLKKSF